jgi:hypothetical protein
MFLVDKRDFCFRKIDLKLESREIWAELLKGTQHYQGTKRS